MSTRQREQSPSGSAPTTITTVDDRIAEELQTEFPCFSTLEIRECAELEPVTMARGVLRWAARKRRPHRALRAWARKHRRGYYRPACRKPSAEEEHRGYLAFIRRKEDESLRRYGCSLSDRRIEALAREFHAPAHRALMNMTPEPARGSLEEEGE